MNANAAVDNLVTELSPELAGVIGQPPEMGDGGAPSKMPGYTAPERDSAKKEGADAARDARAAASGGGISRKFGAILKAIPNLDRLRVYKRQPNGQIGYIGEYRYRDIQHTGDIEVFLAEYVKPTYGPGEYPIKLYNSANQEWDGGSIHLIAPPPATPASQQSDIAMVARELKDAMRPPVAPDPFEQMRRTRQLMKDLKEEGGGDPMMMMMLMQSMSAPKDDSRILSALEKIVTRIEKLETAPPPMSMLPMTPAAPPISALDIANIVTSSLKTVVELVKPAAPATPPIDPFTMAKMLSDASKEGAAAAEKQSDRLISMLENRDRRDQPVASLTDEMEKMRTLHEFVKSFTPQQQQQAGTGGTNFWDAILAFANNERFAGNIGEAIRERAKQPPGQVTITSNKPVPPKQIPQQTQAPQPQVPPRPQTPPPPFVPQQTAPVPTPEVVPSGEGVAPPPTAQPEAPRIFVPDSFKPFCERLDAAATPVDGKVDDGTIATRTIEGLMELFKLAQWRPSVETLLGNIDQDQKDQAMHILGNTLSLLARNGWLQRDSALHSLRVLRDEWDLVRAGVQQLLKNAPLFAAPPPAVAPPADPEAPAAPVAPVDVPDEIMQAAGDEEQEEDEAPLG